MVKKSLGFILILVAGLVTGFLVGRGTVKQKSLKVEQEQTVKTGTVTRIVERPGERVTEIVENKVESIRNVLVKEESKQTEWNLGLEYGVNQPNPVYGLSLSRRVFGPLFLGGTVRTDKSLGVSVSIEF